MLSAPIGKDGLGLDGVGLFFSNYCAGSAVTRDVPSMSIAGGNHAMVIKRRFLDEDAGRDHLNFKSKL